MVVLIDNSQDKGYTWVRLKSSNDILLLREIGFTQEPEEFNFYVDYENGTIYVDWKDGSPNQVIGYYEKDPDHPGFANVYDNKKSRVIGVVGNELIYFRSKEADPSAHKYRPDEECLAYYNPSGSITTKNLLTYMGIINGSELGGAAAFVALNYHFNFHSLYQDFFQWDIETFRRVYSNYLNPPGL